MNVWATVDKTYSVPWNDRILIVSEDGKVIKNLNKSSHHKPSGNVVVKTSCSLFDVLNLKYLGVSIFTCTCHDCAGDEMHVITTIGGKHYTTTQEVCEENDVEFDDGVHHLSLDIARSFVFCNMSVDVLDTCHGYESSIPVSHVIRSDGVDVNTPVSVGYNGKGFAVVSPNGCEIYPISQVRSRMTIESIIRITSETDSDEGSPSTCDMVKIVGGGVMIGSKYITRGKSVKYSHAVEKGDVVLKASVYSSFLVVAALGLVSFAVTRFF